MATDPYKTNTNKKKVLRALKKHRGLVTTACGVANISRTQFYEWMKVDDDFKYLVEQIYEAEVDGVEAKLFDMINEGNTAATIFYLKSKGKKRDYGPTLNIDAKVEGEIKLNAVFKDDLLNE